MERPLLEVLGRHLDRELELRIESHGIFLRPDRNRPFLWNLRSQVCDFDNERRLLIKLSDTGRVVAVVQRSLEVALEILNLQDSEESISWRSAFQQERDEWMGQIMLLLSNDQRMKMEIGDENQSVEILTRLRYGMERYGEVLSPEELNVMSDAFDAVICRSNVVLVEVPRWFATSKHEWFGSQATFVMKLKDNLFMMWTYG
ncbi:hypothetical protein P3T76_008242 [Phytophthora citrophthora]|uniref:Uncharacterized protein n=1 Tax=Phytophthora citrophthora TaxID=4793 RepID=A0AAD9GKA0_9STRA|nr:hypothetical protein P3T76_008242 [Phytophthora citrophthora]